MYQYTILIIDDERGRRYYIRPAERPTAPRVRLVLQHRLAQRCQACGAWPIKGECECMPPDATGATESA
jgi:hypothetical protein